MVSCEHALVSSAALVKYCNAPPALRATHYSMVCESGKGLEIETHTHCVGWRAGKAKNAPGMLLLLWSRAAYTGSP